MFFTLDENHLRRLFAINSFELPGGAMVFFGLRGCLPVDDDSGTFQERHEVQLGEFDYVHPRCTLGQWLPTERTIALFPGSTVPHRRYVMRALDREGRGANQLMTGCYRDYRKGRHRADSDTGHEAFRQTGGRPVRRTADDFDYDNDDRVEFTNPFDNLHAGWCMGVSHESYASAGCQVVVGYPRCPKRGDQPDAGAWRVFRANAYASTQDSFAYMLLNGRDAQRVSRAADRPQSARLRFGSKGDLVVRLQEALQRDGHYEGRVDGDFGDRTLRATLEFQTAAFGESADDGIVGPTTASALRLDWPDL